MMLDIYIPDMLKCTNQANKLGKMTYFMTDGGHFVFGPEKGVPLNLEGWIFSMI